MRITLLYSPCGNGHRAAANAIAEALADYPARVDVHDVLRFAPASFRYDTLWRLIQAYGARAYDRLFDVTDRPYPRVRALRERVNLALFAPLACELLRLQPDRIVCTHYLPAITAAALRHAGLLRGEVSTVITDYIAHEAWFAPGIDRYYVACDTVAADLARRGIAGAKVTGIPLRAEMAAPRRLPPGSGRVLFLASGVPWPLVRAALASIPRDIELEIVAGGDAELRARLVAEQRGPVHGFATDLRRLLDGADVVVTKAGGLVVSECLARGRAMLLPWPAPGQERGNRAHAIAVGAARAVDDPRDTGAALRELPAFAMGRAAARAAAPDAAARIAADLVDELAMPALRAVQ
jgi:processive 1,2-diacylglycerol beta-glucosyltransferase